MEKDAAEGGTRASGSEAPRGGPPAGEWPVRTFGSAASGLIGRVASRLGHIGPFPPGEGIVSLETDGDSTPNLVPMLACFPSEVSPFQPVQGHLR